jgi:predicted kinase
MDLVEKQRHDLAAHFLNCYLECTGDYESMQLLNLFFVYRCLVRAKVAAIRSQERDLDSERTADRAEVRQYADLALRQISPDVPTLVVMSGLSGSGKSWVSGQLMAALPAIRIRSDLERKRMSGLGETDSRAAAIDSGIYSRDTSHRVYAKLCALARTILASGHNVILDAAFLRADERAAAVTAATDCEARSVLLVVTAPTEILRARVLERAGQASDASEAGLEVLEHQLATARPLAEDERTNAVFCDNTATVDIDALAARIRSRK